MLIVAIIGVCVAGVGVLVNFGVLFFIAKNFLRYSDTERISNDIETVKMLNEYNRFVTEHKLKLNEALGKEHGRCFSAMERGTSLQRNFLGEYIHQHSNEAEEKLKRQFFEQTESIAILYNNKSINRGNVKSLIGVFIRTTYKEYLRIIIAANQRENPQAYLETRKMCESMFADQQTGAVKKVKFVDYTSDELLADTYSFNYQRRELPPYKYLARQYNLELSDEPDYLFYSDWGDSEYLNRKYRNCIKIYFTAEAYIPRMWLCDYAFSIRTADHPRSYKFPFYRLAMHNDSIAKVVARTADAVKAIIAEQRKFCYLMASNPNATERIQFFKLLSNYKQVDSGGEVLNNIGNVIGIERGEDSEFRSQYKFGMAFENKKLAGYTTEKLYNVWKNGSVPIYWGNPDVGLEFNTKAFINANDFDTFDELIEHIKLVDNDEALYRTYLSEPLFTNGKDNEYIRDETLYGYFDHIFNSPKPRRARRPLADIVKLPIINIRQRMRGRHPRR